MSGTASGFTIILAAWSSNIIQLQEMSPPGVLTSFLLQLQLQSLFVLNSNAIISRDMLFNESGCSLLCWMSSEKQALGILKDNARENSRRTFVQEFMSTATEKKQRQRGQNLPPKGCRWYCRGQKE